MDNTSAVNIYSVETAKYQNITHKLHLMHHMNSIQAVWSILVFLLLLLLLLSSFCSCFHAIYRREIKPSEIIYIFFVFFVEWLRYVFLFLLRSVDQRININEDRNSWDIRTFQYIPMGHTLFNFFYTFF